MPKEDRPKTQVLFEMLAEICRNPRQTPLQIQNKMDINKYKYHRYFNELSLYFPIYYDRGVKRYVMENPPRHLYPNTKRVDDLLLMLVMLNLLVQSEGNFSGEEVETVCNLLGLSTQLSAALKNWSELASTPPEGKVKDWLLILNNAIINHNPVIIAYKAPGKDIAQIEVYPYRLIHDQEWYLLGLSVKHQKPRNYKILRIEAIQVLEDRKFAAPENLEPRPVSIPWDFGEGEPVEVVIEFSGVSPTYVREKHWHPSQEIEELSPDKIKFKVKVKAFEKMVPWILSHGKNAKVLEPQALKQALKQELASLTAFY